MQIFMPDPDVLGKCVSILQGPDAMEQARSILEIVEVIHETHPLASKLHEHPSVRAWRTYEASLIVHGISLCEKLSSKRMFKDSVAYTLPKLNYQLELAFQSNNPMGFPVWTRNEQLNLSHLSFLVTRTPGRYSTFLGKVPFGMPYIWPGGRCGS